MSSPARTLARPVRKRRLRWEVARRILGLAAAGSSLVVALICGFLVKDAAPVFQSQGLRFLTGREWDTSTDTYGALPMLVGTFWVTVIAVGCAAPVALGSAVFISEVLTGKARLAAKSLIELLAGVPSIVYGLIGIALLLTFVRDIFSLPDGATLLSAGLLLAVMLLPTLMTVAEDALQAVPREIRDAARALGSNRSETILGAVAPHALPALIGAVLLAAGRALGETIAVMLVVGSLDRLPQPFYNLLVPAQTMTSKIGRELNESAMGTLQYSALVGLGLLLFLITLLTTLAVHIVIPRRQAR
ncbi:MAG: phosphate ABC transporter permease subunit PstC [Armatimonadetes bacterium]|nr:phosphate ABC transporter permease subunit PstC [Armatimonadota bacterium]